MATRTDEPLAPSREDPAVAALTGFLGGPWGALAAARRWWTPVRVLLLLAGAAWIAGMGSKRACAIEGWQSPTRDFARMCWNDWGWAGIGQPAGTNTADLPPTAGFVALVTRTLARGVDAADQRVLVAAAATVVVVAVGAVWATWGLATADLLRPWDAAVLALAPLWVLTWATSWHTVAAVAIALALWGWSRGRPVVTGIATGVAAATVLGAASLLLALAVVARRTGRGREAADAATAAAFTWLALVLPPFLLDGGIRGTWWVRPVDSGSLWLVLQQATDHPFGSATVIPLGLALWVVGAAVVLVLALRSPVPLSLAQVALPLVAGALLVSASLPPAASLVLLPLAALAVPRWGVVGAWQATELVHIVVTGWYYAGLMAPGGGGDVPTYWAAIVLRAGGIVLLVAASLRAGAAGSADLDAVEGGRGEADPHLDVLAHGRDPRA